MKAITQQANFPENYKKLEGEEWKSFLGKLAGSAQPGDRSTGIKDTRILAALKNGTSIDTAKIDESLLLNLNSIYQDGIRIIYCLIEESSDRNTDLIKYLWEKIYPDTHYITEIDGVPIGIKDFEAPSTEQIEKICQDALQKIKDGKNILVHCQGGVGRTGTILAAIYMKTQEQHEATKAIQYIRDNYLNEAIESIEQEESLENFAQLIKQQQVAISHRNISESGSPTNSSFKELLKQNSYIQSLSNISITNADRLDLKRKSPVDMLSGQKKPKSPAEQTKSVSRQDI